MADPPIDNADANEPRYRIGMVARKTGLSTHTLRAWERRYGSIAPDRAAGGGRLYSERDVAHLRLLKELTDHGHAIGAIAHLSPEELRRLATRELAEREPSAAEPLARDRFCERFLRAITAYDLTAASQTLAQAALLLSPHELVCELLAPLLQEIGERWERGTLSVAHEHAASALLRSELGNLLRTMGSARVERTVVAATLAGEQHEFGALLAALLAAAHGLRVLYLGANLPAAEILGAVTRSGAEMVLLSIVNDMDAASAAELEKLIARLPRKVTLCIGGRGAHAPRRARSSARVRYVRNLSELEPLLL